MSGGESGCREKTTLYVVLGAAAATTLGGTLLDLGGPVSMATLALSGAAIGAVASLVQRRRASREGDAR